jgi:hypothetical protein
MINEERIIGNDEVFQYKVAARRSWCFHQQPKVASLKVVGENTNNGLNPSFTIPVPIINH